MHWNSSKQVTVDEIVGRVKKTIAIMTLRGAHVVKMPTKNALEHIFSGLRRGFKLLQIKNNFVGLMHAN